MAIEARIRELDSRHETLERAIQDETRRPAAVVASIFSVRLSKPTPAASSSPTRRTSSACDATPLGQARRMMPAG